MSDAYRESFFTSWTLGEILYLTALVGREKSSELTTMVGFENMAAWIGVHFLREATVVAEPNGSLPSTKLYKGRYVRLLEKKLD
jgi:hypothetical protein